MINITLTMGQDFVTIKAGNFTHKFHEYIDSSGKRRIGRVRNFWETIKGLVVHKPLKNDFLISNVKNEKGEYPEQNEINFDILFHALNTLGWTEKIYETVSKNTVRLNKEVAHRALIKRIH